MGTSIWVLSYVSHLAKGHHPEVHAGLVWGQEPGPSSAISKYDLQEQALSFLGLGRSVFFSSLPPSHAFYAATLFHLL